MSNEQPAPKLNDGPAVWPLVIDDMQARHEVGVKRYGVALQPFNGRNALRDAYEECLDMAAYLKQAIIEWDTIKAAALTRAVELEGEGAK